MGGWLSGPVPSNSICGLISTFSGLQSTDLNDECRFSLQGSCFKRNTDLWHWSRGKGAKGARVVSHPLQREGQMGEETDSSRCACLVLLEGKVIMVSKGKTKASREEKW